MTSKGQRMLIKGLSIALGVSMFLVAGAAAIGASVMRGYGAGPFPLDLIAWLALVAAVLLVGWPWLLWKPSPNGRGSDPQRDSGVGG